MADTPLCLFSHPGAVVADILGEALRAMPRLDRKATVPVSGVDGWLVGEAGRQFDEGLRDEHGNGVEVASVGDETEALCFEGDGPSAAEGVQHFGQGVAAGATDLLACLLEHRLVLSGFPRDEPLDQREQPLAFAFLVRFGWEPVGVGG
ncbi:MAG: hypothetical protein ACRDYB_09840, partial [Acidimicrobiales bacterium]